MSISAVGYANQTKEVEVECGTDLQLNFQTTESQISLDEVVVSANRNATTRREAPSLVNILDCNLLGQVAAPTIAEGLSYQPGVRVENSCQNCGFAQVRINGLGNIKSYFPFNA